MALGIADGFAKGFGLVNDLNERRSDQKYREGILRDRQLERESDDRYRSSVLENQAATFQAENDARERAEERAAKDSQRKNELQLKNLDVAQARQNAADTQQNLLQQKIDANNEQARSLKAQETAALVTDQMIRRIANGDFISQEEITSWIELTRGTGFDVSRMFKQDMPSSEDVLRSLSDPDADNFEAVALAADNVLGPLDQANVGQTITKENFPNSYPWMQDGNHTITNISTDSFEDAGNGFVRNVLVRVINNKTGVDSVYKSKMMERREGNTAPAVYTEDQLTSAYAGTQYMSQNLRQYAPELLRMSAQNKFYRNGTLDEKAFSDAYLAARKEVEDAASGELSKANVPGFGKSYLQLSTNPEELNLYALHRIIGSLPRTDTSPRTASRRLIEGIRSNKRVANIEKLYKANFTDTEILYFQNFTDKNNNDEFIFGQGKGSQKELETFVSTLKEKYQRGQKPIGLPSIN